MKQNLLTKIQATTPPGTKVGQGRERCQTEMHLFRVEYIANGTEMSGLALDETQEGVWDTYSKMSTSKEPLTVLDVYPEPL